jgi:hypothetical protein
MQQHVVMCLNYEANKMFFIEYGVGYFIDAKKIKEVWFNKKDIHFYMENDNETSYKVHAGYRYTFLNNLQAINDNFNLHNRYNQINSDT